jgi:hypothetical protein
VARDDKTFTSDNFVAPEEAILAENNTSGTRRMLFIKNGSQADLDLEFLSSSCSGSASFPQAVYRSPASRKPRRAPRLWLWPLPDPVAAPYRRQREKDLKKSLNMVSRPPPGKTSARTLRITFCVRYGEK